MTVQQFNVKTEIMKEISATNDPAMRTVLMLLLGVFEDIGDRIDRVLGNETLIREAVLNGHAPVHHKHHEWLEDRIERDDEIEELVQWIKEKRQEELENKASSRKIRDGVIEKVLGAAMIAAASGVVGFLAARAG